MAWFNEASVLSGNNDTRYDSHHIDRWICQVRPLPLPAHQAPRSGIPLQDLDDMSLLTAPPQLIAHVQRTASQGGLQVVSPRQIPITAMMCRVQGGTRALGDHVVGCVATRGGEWPTIDDYEFDRLLPDEPICMHDPNRGMRSKTKALPLTKATSELSDPILSCLVTGRAVIDILRRPDVMGGADEMTSVLANAWSVGREDIDDLDAFTIGIDGPLHRHAIKTDDVFPMCYAPIHVRRAISVGASEATKNLLPPDTGMDWRRMRMYCEAVFAMSCSIEGIPLNQYIAVPPPGDPGARSDRPGVLCFRPAPASAWCYEASTFSLSPDMTSAPTKSLAIPREVLTALTRHTEIVRPMSFALSRGATVSARRSTVKNVDAPTGETIREGYSRMVQSIVVGCVRGKTAAAALRNMIYSAMESSNDFVRLRLARYISIAEEECRIHLKLTEVPDEIIYRLANRFMDIGGVIRLHVVSEAAKRGHTAEEWWADVTSQVPARFKVFNEGNKGWAVVGLWMLFKKPTDRWKKLQYALTIGAIREAEKGAVSGLSLPPTKGSPERLLEACRGAVKGISAAYAGYYMGVYDVAHALADYLEDNKKPTSAKVMKEAAYLWSLRARCLRGTNVLALKHDEVTTSENHLRVSGEPCDIVVTPSPYRAFQAYKKHLKGTDVLHKTSKQHLVNFDGKKISDAFRTIPERLGSLPKSQVTRYLVEPKRMADDLEEAWSMLAEDLKHVVDVYGIKELHPPDSPSHKKQKIIPKSEIDVNIDFDNVQTPEGGEDYFQMMADIDLDQTDYIDEVLERAGPIVSDMFYEEKFKSVDEMLARVLEIEQEYPAPQETVKETVG